CATSCRRMRPMQPSTLSRPERASRVTPIAEGSSARRGGYRICLEECMQEDLPRVPYMRAAVAALTLGGRLAHVASASQPLRGLHLNECPFPPSDAVIEAIR